MNQLSSTSFATIPLGFAKVRETIPDASAVLQLCIVIGLAMGFVACSVLAYGGIAAMIEVSDSVSQSLLADLGQLSVTDWMQAFAGTR